MSTAQDNQNSNFKLAQYFNLYQDGYAEQMFHEESNINLQYSDSHRTAFNGYTALHLAARHKNKSDITFLLSKGADPTLKNQNGQTPLHFIIQDHCEPFLDSFKMIQSTCKLLFSAQVKSGNLENPTDKNGLSHFHIACMADHAEAVEFFLKGGVSADETVGMDSSTFPGYPPLHLAARCSALEATKVLLKFGANTQLKNTQGMTFMCSLFQVRAEIVHLHHSESIIEVENLILMNFLLESDSFSIDYAGLTHFHVACSGTKLSIAERLLQNVTNINHAVDTDAPHWPGYTALHFAAYSSIEMVKLLVINGANMLAKDARGVTPLDICINRYKLEDVHAVLSLDTTWRTILMSDRKTRLLNLIFAMKDTNQFDNFFEPRVQIVNTSVPLDSPVWQGYTPLHIAVMFYDNNTTVYRDKKPGDERAEYIIAKLMAKGADINAQDIRGRTPLHLAYRYKYQDVDESLMQFRDKIEDVVDDENLSHLHIACRINDVLAVEKILQTTVDVNIAFKGQLEERGISRGSTPLHYVAPNDEIIAMLMARGADPLLKDANGMTAIHHSAGDSDVILSLPNLKDCVVADSGLSHLHIAVRRGNLHAINTLLDNGADVNRALLQDGVLYVVDNGGQNRAGDTPLDLALYGDTGIVELLMRRGAEILVREPADEHAFFMREDEEVLRTVISSLDHDDSFFERLEREIGLSMLHVACSRRDVDLVKALLASGADVDARINVKSRLWPGYTALHVVMNDPVHDTSTSLDEIVRLLLDHGADVTIASCDEGDTALYLAYQTMPRDSPNNRYSCMRMILRAHRDFTVNKIKPNRFSYFDIACSIGETDTAKKFLEHGVDVNESTHFFRYSNRNTGGATPLLLAAASSEYAMDPITQLEMIDLLLNYGADVNAQDVHGDTALHLMAKWNYKHEDVVSRLVKSKADVDLKNVKGQTPLEILITSKQYAMHENYRMEIKQHITAHYIKCFLEFGCFFNVFYSATDKGLIATTMTVIPYEDLLHLIRSSIINFPRLMQTDAMGRTVVHNMVSSTNGFVKNEPVLSDGHYAALIEKLGKFDLDVDDKDKLGRTPLHLAVLFRNTEAISGLLVAGADVNLTDASGKTAFSYLFESCVRCLERESGLRNEDHKQYDHADIFSVFVIHMKKLLRCGLGVNETNQNHMWEAVEKCNSEHISVHEDFEAQINEMKGLRVAQSKLTLTSFLCETGAVVSYATLPQSDRDSVDEFFKYNISDVRSRYTQVASILLLQYRKAIKRLELNQPAQLALNILSRLPLPDLCSEAILKLLSNSELSCMIEAAG